MANTTNASTNASKAVAGKTLNLSEGTRQQLAMYGYAVSPFSGVLLLGTGSNDVREATKAEYDAAVKAYQSKLNTAKTSNLI